MTYSSVVSRDSVRICLLYAALNNLDVSSADIQNAYLSAPPREKRYTIAGAEFGSEKDEIMLVVRALYGLRSSGAAFRQYLADILTELDFISCRGDPDVWRRSAVKPGTTEYYYEYLLVYVDDIICVSANPDIPMKQIKGQGVKYKNDTYKSPDTFLGSQLSFKAQINTPPCWHMSSNKYINEAIKSLEATLVTKYPNQKAGDPMRLSTKVTVPIHKSYKAELDTSPSLNDDDTRWYQELIGILRWAVELGRVDIHYEVSLLSTHLAAPRMGHLHQVIHIFSYLKKTQN